MKEYLKLCVDGDYVSVNAKHPASGWIEVPEGAMFAWKCEDGAIFFTGLEMGYRDAAVVWQRPAQPEELPFIDDNPHSINDQYAEIEKVRKAVKVKSGSESDHAADAVSYGLIGIKQDNVNHPSHYTNGKVECIYALESATVGKSGIEAVCVANVIKYLWRYEDKNGIEDVKKAKWYLDKLLNVLENK